MPLVTYIIVTWNRKAELVSCLRSIREQDYSDKELIVVDNGSQDGTCEVVCEQFPEVRLISRDDNYGAAAGRNLAIEAAQGEICIVIDDDAAFADPGATRRAVDYFRHDPKLAVVAFQIRTASTDTPARQAVPRADKKLPDGDFYCTYFSSCGAAIRRHVFVEVDMFWEKLFYGAEELDLAYRLLDQGYKIIYSSSIHVLHLHTPTARPPNRWTYVATRNRCWVAVRNLPWYCACSTIAVWWTYVGFHCVRHGGFRTYARAIVDAIRGLPEVFAERRCIGSETVKQLRALSGRLWF